MSEDLREDLRRAIGDYKHQQIERKLVLNAMDDLKQFHMLCQLQEDEIDDWPARATYIGCRQIFRESDRAGRAAVNYGATMAWLESHEDAAFRKAADTMAEFFKAHAADFIGDTEYQLLVDHVKDDALRRRLYQHFSQSQALLKRRSLTPDQLHRLLTSGFQRAWRGFSTAKACKSEADIWKDLGDKKALEESRGLIEETPEQKEAAAKTRRYFTPWRNVNDVLTGGFGMHQYMVVAARPHMGKSAFLVQLLRHLIRESGQAGLLMSLEMPGPAVGGRSLAQQFQKPTKLLRAAELYHASENDAVDLMIDDQVYRSIDEVGRALEMAKMKKKNLLWWAIDYAQLLAPSDAACQSEVSKGIKRLIGSLDLAGIAALQVGRHVEARKDTRPLLADIKESGQYEQDADIVAMLWRACYYDETKDPADAMCYIRKQRDGGGTGEAALGFNGSTVSFFQPKSTQFVERPVQQPLIEVPNMF